MNKTGKRPGKAPRSQTRRGGKKTPNSRGGQKRSGHDMNAFGKPGGRLKGTATASRWVKKEGKERKNGGLGDKPHLSRSGETGGVRENRTTPVGKRASRWRN